MPKLGMEPIRRDALVQAAISEVAKAGSRDVTVSRIARAAGVSSALAHHYFGTKDALLLSAMRHILRAYGTQVREGLAAADRPRARVEAVIRASFTAPNFRPEVISAWLTFYVMAQTDSDAHRLLTVYKGRLRSNLVHGLRPLAGERAPFVAEGVASMIDGIYIRQGLDVPDPERATRLVLDHLDRQLERQP